MNDFFASLPTGKNDKPLLFATGPLVYDFHDIDGLYFMLDRRLSGCLILMWAKQMDDSVKGKVTLDGKSIGGYVLESMELMGNMWILGVPLRGLVTEYSKNYTLHVEGFRDTDGNEMDPQDLTVTGIDREEPKAEYAGHEAVALQSAQEGIVLLKNQNDVLPLRRNTTLNLFGKGVHEFRIGAVGAGKINPRYSINLVEAVHDRTDYTLNEELSVFYGCDKDLIPPEDMLERAKEKSDIAVMLITRAAGENMDCSTAKGEFYLDDEEDVLIRKLTDTFSKTVVILNVGYPIDVTFAEKYKVDGLIYLGYAGMLAGPALMDILSGDVNPSGKLPDTWAQDYFDIPAAQNFYDCADKPRLDAECELFADTVYEEDIYVGYRYFTTFHKKPAFPFGFGLSYTTFVIEPESFCYDGENLTCVVHVKNMGNLSGKEVVQVYIGKPDKTLEKPERELVAFEKTKELTAGEEQELTFVIPKKHLTSYRGEDASYILESGNYRIFIGNSSEVPNCGEFYVAAEEVIKKVTNLMIPGREIETLSKRNPEKTYPKGKDSGVVEGKTTFQPYQERKKYPAVFHGEKPIQPLTYEDIKKNPENVDVFVAQLSVQELARISVCASAGWGMEGIGEAGRVFQSEGLNLPDFPVSDGNSGVNLNMKNIGMPSGVTICATFNKELSAKVGKVIGEEAKAFGVPMILAPALNIHRNPLNGRQPEYFSEDPYLAGVMAGEYSKGMESAGTASCMKHLMANNCESTRKRNQSIISERAIREIYFKAFEIAMEVHMPASFMTAYNAVNGRPTSADPELLCGLLREENGFDGFIMTDWTSYDTADIAEMVQAGNCWITPGSKDDTYTSQIVRGIEDGRIELARLQSNVAYMIRTMIRFA